VRQGDQLGRGDPSAIKTLDAEGGTDMRAESRGLSIGAAKKKVGTSGPLALGAKAGLGGGVIKKKVGTSGISGGALALGAKAGLGGGVIKKKVGTSGISSGALVLGARAGPGRAGRRARALNGPGRTRCVAADAAGAL
jgi:hypothetical protein